MIKKQQSMIFNSYLLFWKHYFDFKSISRRSHYWWVFLWNWLIRIIFLLWGIINYLEGKQFGFRIGIGLFLIYSLLTLIPSLSLTARRYRDAQVSPWWMLFTYLLPYILKMITRSMNPVTLKVYLIQNLGDFLEFICIVVAIILPLFPSQSKNYVKKE